MNYVDLGLSVKWADCNVGAEDDLGFGEYYNFSDVKDYPNLPTLEQWEELLRECEFKYDKETKAIRVIGKNRKEILFPIAGERDGQVEDKTVGAFFWTSTEFEENGDYAWYAYISKKTYSAKLKKDRAWIEKDKFHISVRTIEPYSKMDTNTKYKVVFYVDTLQEVENLINGDVKPENYNYQVLESANDKDC